MRKLFTLLVAALLTASVFAQSPEKMSYQAVIRNSSDILVTNTGVGMQISILQGSASGSSVYVERQFPTTNANGLVSIEIGAGTVVSGTFATIDWASGPYFIKTETDLAGGANYTITGTSQLLSVPYALHAKTAESVTGSITEIDPIFGASVASGITATDTNNWNNKLDSYTETDPAYTAKFDLTNVAIGDLLKYNGTKFVKFTPNFLTVEVDSSVTNEIELPTTVNTGDMAYWNGTAWVVVNAASSNGQTLYFINNKPQWGPVLGPTDVMNSTTGEIWMDRNLGATQVATSSTDANAYGDLYQWGRGTDGHQIRTSSTTSTLATSDNPGHGNFIIIGSSDWRSPQNNNLWQGVSGTNNPCPSGYRLPTEAEWSAERLSWSSNNATGAFASPLKLPVAGYRFYILGTLNNVGSTGIYWSSTVFGTGARDLYFDSSNANMASNSRASGFSVRCIKD